MNRRRFLGLSAATLGAAMLPSLRNAYALTNSRAGQRLVMPPLIDTRQSGRLAMTAEVGWSDFLGAEKVQTMGYNGAYLGPTIVMQKGALATNITNTTAEPVTVHWHGMLVPGEHDGSGHSPVRPGEAWTPELSIEQRPTTAWYHSHIHHATARQVYAGLAGVIHVTDGRDDERGLPSEYGVDDLTLVLQDRRFDAAGRMIYNPSFTDNMNGFTGERMIVSGQAGAVAVVPRGIVRLRFVNGSNARFYTLNFNDKRPLHLIGTDGGLLTKPVAVKFLPMAPGERTEVLVDFSEGPPPILMSSRGLPLKIMDFAIDDTLTPRITRLPETLDGDPVEMAVPDNVITRRFGLNMGGASFNVLTPEQLASEAAGGMHGHGHGDHSSVPSSQPIRDFGINGKSYNASVIDFEVKRGTVELWVINGGGGIEHPFHVHGVHFKVVSVGGNPLDPKNTGWKDTVVINAETQILVRFDHLAPRDKPYMYHCHILEHEDAGMMGQFVVV
jgi:blue copper oxidase